MLSTLLKPIEKVCPIIDIVFVSLRHLRKVFEEQKKRLSKKKRSIREGISMAEK